MMRQAHLARTWAWSAADERRVRNRVMRRTERSLGHQSHAGRKQPRHRVHGRHIYRFIERQRRQNARDTPGHHRFAGARRTDDEQVVAAGAGDLERAAGEELTANVSQVGALGEVPRCGARQGKRTTAEHGKDC